MRLKSAIFSVLAGLSALYAADVADLHPPWDALKLVSFNRGDASDTSWMRQAETKGSGVTFPAGYRTADFDGTSNAVVSYPDSAYLETFPLSVLFWFRIDSPPGAAGPSLVGKQAVVASPSYSYRGWNISYTSSSFGIIITQNEDTFTKYRYSTNGQTGYGDGVWRHCAVVFTGLSTNPLLYINGESSALTHGGGSYPTTVATTETLKLGGKSYYEQASFLNGALDDIRIYSAVKTANEIGAIYAEGQGVSRP